MAINVNGTIIPENGSIFFNGTDLTRVIANGITVWEKKTGDTGNTGNTGDTGNENTGNTVTYVVSGNYYEEQIDNGASVLNPTVVNPYLEGAEFLGWSRNSYSETVETYLTMGDSPVTLYAVFQYNDYNTGFTCGEWIGEQPTTLYSIDQNKYSSHTVTAKITDVTFDNGTTGRVECYANVDGIEVRGFYSHNIDSEIFEEPEDGNNGTDLYPGYGGIDFTITADGDLTAWLERLIGTFCDRVWD